MLASRKMIGFVTTTDAARARKFYEEMLGFHFVKQDQFALVVETEQNMIRISPVKSHQPAGHTVMGWEVSEIDRVAGWLSDRGVTFERFPGLKQNEVGIWDSPSGDRVAWFKDPDGN